MTTCKSMKQLKFCNHCTKDNSKTIRTIDQKRHYYMFVCKSSTNKLIAINIQNWN